MASNAPAVEGDLCWPLNTGHFSRQPACREPWKQVGGFGQFGWNQRDISLGAVTARGGGREEDFQEASFLVEWKKQHINS